MVQIDFKGKQFVRNYHLAVKYHQLVPDEKKSLTDKISLHDNLIIHGDNLKALKALLPTYAGRIKCIYIDPPYNTGNEGWVYNDNVNSPMMQEWLGRVVDKEDLTRHDKWLCMMWPRLMPRQHETFSGKLSSVRALPQYMQTSSGVQNVAMPNHVTLGCPIHDVPNLVNTSVTPVRN